MGGQEKRKIGDFSVLFCDTTSDSEIQLNDRIADPLIKAGTGTTTSMPQTDSLPSRGSPPKEEKFTELWKWIK